MVTRLYPEAILTPPVSPAFSSDWNATSVADRGVMQAARRGTPATLWTAFGDTSATSPWNVLGRQLVSPTLVGDQVISGTLKGQIRSFESSTAADARAQLVAKVVSGDGTVVRGVLWAADVNVLSSEWTTTATNRKHPLAAISPVTLSPVNALDGDRVVIEVGGRFYNLVNTSYGFRHWYGSDNAQDLPEDETTTSAFNPWFEFSQDLVFINKASVAAVAESVAIKSVGKARLDGVWGQVAIRTATRTGARAAYEALVLADGATAFYKLDETSGTTFDNAEGTAARDGTSYGTPTLGDPSLVPNNPSGKSFATDGTAGIDTPALTDWTQQEFSLEATVKTSSVLTTDQFIIGKDTGGTASARQWQLKKGGTHALTINLLNGSTVIVTGAGVTPLNDGVPHHILMTYDGVYLRALVDGNVEIVDTNTAGTLIAAGTTGFAIGSRAAGVHTLPWIGNIDDVAFYPRALSVGEAKSHYVAWAEIPVAPPTTPTFDGWGIAV